MATRDALTTSRSDFIDDELTETRRLVRAMSEEQQMSELVTRLVSQYSSRKPGEIAQVVQRARDHFAASPIRDFVPLLVERRARAELSPAGRVLSKI